MNPKNLLYHSLVAGLAAGMLYQSLTVLVNSVRGMPTYVAIHTPSEMYVEFPLLFV